MMILTAIPVEDHERVLEKSALMGNEINAPAARNFDGDPVRQQPAIEQYQEIRLKLVEYGFQTVPGHDRIGHERPVGIEGLGAPFPTEFVAMAGPDRRIDPLSDRFSLMDGTDDPVPGQAGRPAPGLIHDPAGDEVIEMPERDPKRPEKVISRRDTTATILAAIGTGAYFVKSIAADNQGFAPAHPQGTGQKRIHLSMDAPSPEWNKKQDFHHKVSGFVPGPRRPFQHRCNPSQRPVEGPAFSLSKDGTAPAAR
jgi:hypothetical protein